MTGEQREAYWKHYARVHEATAKSRGDYDVLKAKAAELDQYKAANATEHEKAVTAAAEAARAQVLKETGPRLVAAEFRAASAGRHTPEQLAAILGPLDTSYFLDPTGNVDTAKVATYVGSIAPVGTPPAPPAPPAPPTWPDMGQGPRPAGTGPSVAAGADLYNASKKPATS